MRTLRRIPLTDVEKNFPVLNEKEMKLIIGGHYVTIDVYRYGYGTDSTLSTFSVSVLETCGQTEPCYPTLSGYMLEPRVDNDLATTAGSDTAIPAGSYTVYRRDDGKWELMGVYG